MITSVYGNRVMAIAIKHDKYCSFEDTRCSFILDEGVQDCGFGKIRIVKFGYDSYKIAKTKNKSESVIEDFYLISNQNILICKEIYALEKRKRNNIQQDEIIAKLNLKIEQLKLYSEQVSLDFLLKNPCSSFDCNFLIDKTHFLKSAILSVKEIELLIEKVIYLNIDYFSMTILRGINIELLIDVISKSNKLDTNYVRSLFLGLGVGSDDLVNKLSLIECFRYNVELFHLLKNSAE